MAKDSKQLLPSDIPFPMRLNRFMALKGLATRRKADELIAAGWVQLDGKVAKVGDKVVHDGQVVTLDERAEQSESEYVYYAYYKPRGIITHSPQHREQSIADVSGIRGVFPVGRLDKDSEGLIILTNDGRITERLLSPRLKHEKEYIVTVREVLPREIKKILEQGIEDGGERLTAEEVTLQGRHQLHMVLTEGKKHEIRRMLATFNLKIIELRRVRIMGVLLGALRPGEKRALTGKARRAFLEALGLLGK
ncbi:MAG: rRNA pseudouridine synthase [Candidatus Moraniibacteriota bacterium]|nr:MAG: rRNA pseudouridine synthase [Candidatus Moranbacteria bacterium]